jgi:hypothetical protein
VVLHFCPSFTIQQYIFQRMSKSFSITNLEARYFEEQHVVQLRNFLGRVNFFLLLIFSNNLLAQLFFISLLPSLTAQQLLILHFLISKILQILFPLTSFLLILLFFCQFNFFGFFQ